METKVTVREIVISVLMMISYIVSGVGIIKDMQGMALIALIFSGLFSVWMLYEVAMDTEKTIGEVQQNVRTLEIPDRPIEKIDRVIRKKKETSEDKGNVYIQTRLSDYDNIDFEINDEGITTSVVQDFRQVKAKEEQHVTIATAKQQAREAAKQTEEAAKKAKANVIQASNIEKITEAVQKRQEQEKAEEERKKGSKNRQKNKSKKQNNMQKITQSSSRVRVDKPEDTIETEMVSETITESVSQMASETEMQAAEVIADTPVAEKVLESDALETLEQTQVPEQIEIPEQAETSQQAQVSEQAETPMQTPVSEQAEKPAVQERKKQSGKKARRGKKQNNKNTGTTAKKEEQPENKTQKKAAASKKPRKKQKFVPDFQPEVYSDFEKNYATDGDDSYLYDGIVGEEGVGNMRVYKRGEEIQYHSDED